MTDLYKNKYRISSARRPDWDYGSHGLYFITICTKDRVRYFGEITEESGIETQSIASLRRTALGEVAYDNLLAIPSYHPYIELDEFVIMPDHIHAILFINKPYRAVWETSKFGPQRSNLASVMRGYKSSVTKFATMNNIEFEWQPRYHDRVIRDHQEYLNIRDYIYNNVDLWLLGKDEFEYQ
jgi:REP element-mobilizing transposase RayT